MAYDVQNGNNMPVQAPLIPDPFVPYDCPDNATLSVFCRVDPALLKRYLAPTPFEPRGDIVVVYASDFTNCRKAQFMDAGIIVPMTFQGQPGATYLFEYEDNDAAIAAGRDLWGYPKKYAEISLKTEGDTATASVVRRGTEILRIEADLSQPHEFQTVRTAPHFHLHVQPGPDGKVLSRRVIKRDTSPDFQLKSSRTGTARVVLASLPADPLAEFMPQHILGAVLTRGDFYATEENGWGKTVLTME
ncbi:acetoacetate decarboxylase family protein [Frigidibacter sp.]|uniref:acetoacetate decarboxylase family protein n=1 Tax=Frigidibacter sp. TaxID=2586418 RepID=UPI002736CDBB|nr:acetoacetate decarboxylase family protein [Frigidibacter sp.]MDP3342162.1 acetoacetate decarboxylase family protein [Frigidibacter sp.]